MFLCAVQNSLFQPRECTLSSLCVLIRRAGLGIQVGTWFKVDTGRRSRDILDSVRFHRKRPITTITRSLRSYLRRRICIFFLSIGGNVIFLSTSSLIRRYKYFYLAHNIIELSQLLDNLQDFFFLKKTHSISFLIITMYYTQSC